MEHQGHEHHHHHHMESNSTMAPPHLPTQNMTDDGIDHSQHQHHAHHNTEVDDHSAHSGHAGGHSMVFHGGVTELILFQFWDISTPTGMIFSFIGIFILAFLYEGLKAFRASLQRRACYCTGTNVNEQLAHRCPPQCCQNGEPGRGTDNVHSCCDDGTKPAQGEGAVRIVSERSFKIQFPPMHWLHFVQTLLHLVQLLISYALMLIFMTYNLYLCLAVALGAAAGYFIFGWSDQSASSEHCN